MVLILAIGSDKLLRKICTGNNVEVNVHNGLTCTFTAVIDRSESAANALDLCYFRNSLCDLG